MNVAQGILAALLCVGCGYGAVRFLIGAKNAATGDEKDAAAGAVFSLLGAVFLGFLAVAAGVIAANQLGS